MLYYFLIAASLYGKLLNPYCLYVSLSLLDVRKVVDLLVIHVSILFCISLDISHFVEKSFDSDHPEKEHGIYHVFATIVVSIIASYQSKEQNLHVMGVPLRRGFLMALFISTAHVLDVFIHESSIFILVLGLVGFTSFNMLMKTFDVLLNRIHSFHPLHNQLQHELQLFKNQFHCNISVNKIIRCDIDKVVAILSVDHFMEDYQSFFNKFIKVDDLQLEIKLVR